MKNANTQPPECAIKLVNPAEWEMVPFLEHPGHDSIWALTRGQDGHIYIGLAQEFVSGGIAHLYRYNVDKRRLEHCLDMSEVTGEPYDSGHATQCKIHFALCPDSKGRIFGATHCTAPPLGHPAWNAVGAWGDPTLNFPGSHLFQYDTATGKAIDFGVLWPNQGAPYLLLNEELGRLYGVTFPKAHFFSTDLQGRDLRDYGRVSSWYPIGMCLDGRKNIWFSDSNGQLVQFDLKKDRLIFTRQYPYAHPWNRSRRYSWLSNMNMADDGMIYCTPYCNDHLSRFDPEAKRPRFEDLGPGVPGIKAKLLRCLVPDGKGHVYYSAAPDPAVMSPAHHVFMKYHIASGEKEVIGRQVIHNVPATSWIGVTDNDGNIYIKGSGQPMHLAIYRPNK